MQTELWVRLIASPIDIMGEREITVELSKQLREALLNENLHLAAFIAGQLNANGLRALAMLETAINDAAKIPKPPIFSSCSEKLSIAATVAKTLPALSAEDCQLVATALWESYMPTIIDKAILADIEVHDKARTARNEEQAND